MMVSGWHRRCPGGDLRDQKGLGTELHRLVNAPQNDLKMISYSLLFCKIAGGAEDDNNCVILQLNGPSGAGEVRILLLQREV